MAHLSALNTQRDIIEIILLAKKYRIKEWLRESYMTLVQRRELTIDNMLSPRTLDWETISRIFAVQSLVKHWQPPPLPRTYCGSCLNGRSGYNGFGGYVDNCAYKCANFISNQSVHDADAYQIDLATIGVHIDRIFQQEFAEANIGNEN